MKILHITCSARGGASSSYRMSLRIMESLLERHPEARIVAHDLASHPLPHIDGRYAAALGGFGDLPGGRGQTSQFLAFLTIMWVALVPFALRRARRP